MGKVDQSQSLSGVRPSGKLAGPVTAQKNLHSLSVARRRDGQENTDRRTMHKSDQNAEERFAKEEIVRKRIPRRESTQRTG